MTKDNLEQIHQMLDLDLSSNTISKSINIGQFKLEDNDAVFVDLMERYFNHVFNIYKENKKILYDYDKVDPVGDMAYQANKVIKKRFFPTYSQYSEIFNSSYQRDNLLSELSFIPSSWENDRKAFVSRRKDTIEDYKKFVYQYAPTKLKQRVKATVPLYIHHKYTEKSVYISGKSGSGKTEILKTMIMSNISQNNSSVIILDIHGDYSLQILQFIEDKSRIVYIDLFDGDDTNVMPSLNPFEISDRTDETLIGYASQNISSTLKAIIGTEFSLVMESLLAPMLNTLLRIEGSTFFDLYKFCDDELNQDLVAFGVKNCDTMNAHYLKYDFYKADPRTKKALKTRLQILLNHEKFRYFLTGKSTFNLQEAMNSNKIIIFRFNKVKLRETMSHIGRFIISFVQTYAMLREEINVEYMRPTTYMYIDEFQNFVNEDIDEILSESRKFRLYLVLAHQFIAQLENTRIRESILVNTQIKIIGTNSYAHNQLLSKQFAVKPEELETLKNVGEFYFRKNQDKAFKFKGSKELIDRKVTKAEIKAWEKELQHQLTMYYSSVIKKDSLFVDVPTEKKDIKKDHYAKGTKDDLLAQLKESIQDDDEPELLDF